MRRRSSRAQIVFSQCRSLPRSLSAILLLLLIAADSHAADKRWNNTFGGAFNAAANWSGGVPGSGDIAEFGLATLFTPGTYTVAFDVSPTNQAVHVEDDSVTFDLNGRTYTTTLFVGNEIGNQAGSLGQLTITDGTWHVDSASDSIDVGAVATSTGSLTVTTAGRITGLPSIFAGLLGTGTLTVQNGGTVQAGLVMVGQQTNANGTVNVTGTASALNSSILNVGQFGTGSMNISAGGVVQSSIGGTIGNFVDALGTVQIDGFNSRWINSNSLVIANAGEGNLNLTDGGRVQNTIGFVGSAAGGSGTVTISSLGFFTSQWLNSGELNIGYEGDGTLNLLSGSVQNTNAFVGRFAGSTGEVNLSAGNAQWLNLGNLTIGHSGEGILNVTGSGYVQNVDGVVGAVVGATGSVSVSQPESQWRSTGAMTVGLGGHGELSVSDGGIVQVDGTMFIAQDLNSVGVVTVDGMGSDLNSSTGMQIGNSGQATLTVTNGGSLSSTFSEIGGLVGINSSVTIDGPGSTWITTGIIEVGDAGDATLTISNGGVVRSGTGALADAADATTSATVTGAGSAWIMHGSGTFYVGEDGTGTLNILDGGAVSNVEGHVGFDVGSNGTALVDGAGSTWTNSGELTIGRDGDGTLDITGGGLVQNTNGYIGRSSGRDGSGAVTVSGAGSTWTNTNFVYVGYDSEGEGSLSVEAGGTVTCTTGFVGNVAGSHGTATVDGPGSTWTTSGTLAVGDGTLTISNGGAVVTNGLFGTLAAASMWNAEVSVVGQGSSWSLADALLTVGFGGAAAVNILDGGNVVSFDARLAADTGSTGTVVVSGAGSTWTIGRRLGVGGDAGNLMSGGTGTLSVQPGGRVDVAQNIVIFADGLLRLEGGTLDAAEVSFQGGGQFDWTTGTLHVGTFGGSLVNQAGKLAPGHSAGSTTIAGSYAQQAGATLEIEIGGTSAGAFDVVNIGNIAGISGQLQLALINGFEPGAGDTFMVLTTAGGIFGTLANVANGQRLTTLDSLGSFLVHYGQASAFNPNQIVLSAFEPAELPGDFNFDGRVDAADYTVWRDGLGSSYTMAGYDVWKTHFGETAGSGSGATAAVPEPATFSLAALSALSLLVTCRRRSSSH